MCVFVAGNGDTKKRVANRLIGIVVTCQNRRVTHSSASSSFSSSSAAATTTTAGVGSLDSIEPTSYCMHSSGNDNNWCRSMGLLLPFELMSVDVLFHLLVLLVAE